MSETVKPRVGPEAGRPAWLWWGPMGVALIGLLFALARLSGKYEYGGDPAARPTPQAVALMIAAGTVYLVSFWGLRRASATRAPM